MDPRSSHTSLSHELLERLASGLPIKLVYRDKLAARLGIRPCERLSLKIVQEGGRMAVSALLDGGDLTPAQTEVFVAFLNECGVETLEVEPERPVAS